MNVNIQNLARIAGKKERRIIGLMSGTSVDGLDIAVCRISGSGFETTLIVEASETISYEDVLKEELNEICFKENISLQKLTLLNKNIAKLHASMINAFLFKHHIDKGSVDLIASHGQTAFHISKRQGNQNSFNDNATLQIGDADQISVKTGIITISDFRQKHIAGGGEGAPLAAYGDLILFADKEHDVIMLNIGGIANCSFLPRKEKMICTDIGPGNTLMDMYIRTNFPGKYFDDQAATALKGEINEALLAELKDHDFFKMIVPKTTGPEIFSEEFLNNALKKTEQLYAEDIMATLNKFTADIVISAINKISSAETHKLYVSGGGIHNPLLMQHLKTGLPHSLFCDVAEKNIPADAKEAVLFALLANECVAGDPDIFTGVSENMPAICMGKISFPY